MRRSTRSNFSPNSTLTRIFDKSEPNALLARAEMGERNTDVRATTPACITRRELFIQELYLSRLQSRRGLNVGSGRSSLVSHGKDRPAGSGERVPGSALCGCKHREMVRRFQDGEAGRDQLSRGQRPPLEKPPLRFYSCGCKELQKELGSMNYLGCERPASPGKAPATV